MKNEWRCKNCGGKMIYKKLGPGRTCGCGDSDYEEEKEEQ
jgi:DNA-directed RNA polymerase subunit RPC12/RpoP